MLKEMTKAICWEYDFLSLLEYNQETYNECIVDGRGGLAFKQHLLYKLVLVECCDGIEQQFSMLVFTHLLRSP